MRKFDRKSVTTEGLDWDRPYGTVYGGFKAKYDQDNKYFDSHGAEMRVGETSKTLRFHKKILKPYLVGKGIDIGCGRDPVAEGVRTFDLEDGDAERINESVKEKFDYVFSSHCLEHLDSPEKALSGWWSLVKKGGHLILIVPDEDLYEQGCWPSRFSQGHKHTFTIHKDKSWSPVSINLTGMLERLGGKIVLMERQDDGHDYEMGLFDQTSMSDDRLAQIAAIIQTG